jgi:glycine hydroxymethyltransferase
MDRVGELIHTVLTETAPDAGPDGRASKAKYTLDRSVADRVARQAAELLADYPLYPMVDLS